MKSRCGFYSKLEYCEGVVEEFGGEVGELGGRLCVCVCVCVCLSRRANLRTGASRRLTEDTIGLSGTFLYNCFVRKLEAL